ncbi:hypothetical protein L218DRAFT_691850 [Marasmius fiardii PR-910]|nr:hypothetical protein L218DRAFT_691850 [Marasmius fiardii PR-910]
MLSSKTVLIAIAYFTLSSWAAPVRREVPQEHSHEPILRAVSALVNKNNPDNLGDSVFGLLGNAAAQNGLGNSQDPNCLQQNIADRAFTNAKAAGDVDGQVNALIYRALERNSGSVGGTTTACTTAKAVNPEIAAIQQHQDPASPNAAQVNKAIALELAKQIASVGGDPTRAIESGTFKPGQLGDPTAKGNSCDDANDANGCINTLNLLVPDVTDDEIKAAVAGVSNNTGNGTVSSSGNNDNGNGTVSSGNNTPTDSSSSSSSSGNLQTFTGALGNQAAPAVTKGGRGFQVQGSDDFLNVGAALGRSCDIQHNKCANAANSGGGFSVGDCDAQNTQCKATIQA